MISYIRTLRIRIEGIYLELSVLRRRPAIALSQRVAVEISADARFAQLHNLREQKEHNGKGHYPLIPLSHNVPPPTSLLRRSLLQAFLTCSLQQRLNETPTAARQQHIQMPATRAAEHQNLRVAQNPSPKVETNFNLEQTILWA